MCHRSLASETLAVLGAYTIGRRTEKSADAAQAVAPSTSQMRALSMLPVPTRLYERVRHG
jgi:hypothetical protein